MIDTHCHLVSSQLGPRLQEVLANAAQAGVDRFITVATGPDDTIAGLEVAKSHDNVWCSAGIHPHEADAPHDFSAMMIAAADDRCVAWGELGLDWYYKTPLRQSQQTLLESQLAAIEDSKIDLPVILHCREAVDDLLAVLHASNLSMDRCVFHCYTGDPATLRPILDAGCHVSFTGVVTFPSAPEVAEAAALVPIDRLMVETDAPYLSPEPVRKMRPNEPCNVVHTARFLAELRNMDHDEFIHTVDANAVEFFGLDC
jgi:TatD DNase family protein